MKKGYWIVAVDVLNPQSFQQYIAENGRAFQKYDARFLVRAGQQEVIEGHARSRNTIVEFPSYQAALDCWHSEEYQQALNCRRNAAEFDLVIIEGYGDD